MITEEEYNNALNIIDKYRKQLRSSGADIYERVRAEMMAKTDITLEVFEEVLQMWINIKKKELSIAEFEKNNSNF